MIKIKSEKNSENGTQRTFHVGNKRVKVKIIRNEMIAGDVDDRKATSFFCSKTVAGALLLERELLGTAIRVLPPQKFMEQRPVPIHTIQSSTTRPAILLVTNYVSHACRYNREFPLKVESLSGKLLYIRRKV